MIWATVSSWSCFCWLYRASSSSIANNIINLISVLTIWWSPCVALSLVLLEEGVCYDQCGSLGKTLLAFALLHFVLQAQTCLSLQISLDFLLLFLPGLPISPPWTLDAELQLITARKCRDSGPFCITHLKLYNLLLELGHSSLQTRPFASPLLLWWI